jgi:hypothetical protein
MALVAPKKRAKKSTTKPPGKEVAKKGPKAPFVMPQKAPTERVKPESWTEEHWHDDCLRCRLSMAERRERRVVEKERKTTVSLVQ